jgi:hypothetical protein
VKLSETNSFILPNWWWRRIVFLKFDDLTHTTKWKAFPTEDPNYSFSMEWNAWHKEEEFFAYRYELIRRFAIEELPELPNLPYGICHSVLSGILGPPKERSIAMLSTDNPPGYAKIKDWQWDLTASDEALSRRFLLFINEARAKAGLPDTRVAFFGKVDFKSSRRGKRNRPVSWLAVEAFDLRKQKVRALTDSERSVLSKAAKEGKELGNRCKEALASAKEFFGDPADSTQPNLYWRFLKENIAVRASKTPSGD